MRLPNATLSILIAGALAPASLAQSTYVIGGPANSLSPSSGVLGWDGTEMAAYRAAVEDRELFGPDTDGFHPVVVETRSLTSVNDNSLAGVDAFVCSYWADSEITPAQSDALVDFFLGGGDLIIVTDDNDHDEIADRLGLRVLPGFNETSAETAAPLGDGIFGRVSGNTVPLTAPGYIDAGRVLSKNGHVGAITPFQLAAAAWWNKGDYGPNTGALVVLADPGLLTDGDYPSFDTLALIGLNMTEFLSKRAKVKVIGGPAASLQPSSGTLTWQGGAATGDVKVAMADDLGFGPEKTDIRFRFYDSINNANLGLCDTFVVPFWNDADLSATHRNAIVNSYLGGMNLVVWFSLDNQASILGDLNLGIQADSGSTAMILDPLSFGPFGAVNSLPRDAGSAVTLDRDDILDRNGYIAAVDADGDPVAAYFLEKDLPGLSANLVVVAEDGWIRDGGATFDPPNLEGRFALNTFHRVMTDRKIRVAGPSSNLNPSSLGWDGAGMAMFRNTLMRPDYFGPQGRHNRGIDVLEMGNLDELTLATMDVVVTGLWNDPDIDHLQVAALLEFAERGGRVLLTPEDNGADDLAIAFGFETDDVNASPTTGSAPCYVGPFGTASVVTQADTSVIFDETALLERGGLAIGRNGADQVVVALLKESALDPKSGEVLAIGDVHMLVDVDYNLLDTETIFALNSIASLAELPSCLPDAFYYGYGHPGSGGLTPTMKIEGSLLDRTMMRLRVANAVGGSTALLLFGTSGRFEFPYRDATILVSPAWSIVPFQLGGGVGVPGAGIGDGVIRLNPGFGDQFLFQVQGLIFDPGASRGVATTEGLEVLRLP